MLFRSSRMAAHASALVEWNRKINLTAITDPVLIAIKHFLDAVLPLPHLPSEPPLLDLGTGPGFPGIPIKIMRPDQPVTLVDASRKKINFVKHVLRTVQISNACAIQARAEDLMNDPLYQRRYGVIVCRAFADLDTIACLAAPFLSADGNIYVYQGPGGSSRTPVPASVERQNALTYQVVATHAYVLPILGDRRLLTVIVPTAK